MYNFNLTDRTILQNEITAWDYFIRLCEMSLACFKWNNLPDTCDPRYLELALLETGKAIFFKDDVLGYLTLKCAVNGGFNVYGIPIDREIYGYNGYRTTRTDKDSVIIYNNKLHNNQSINLISFSRRLYEIDRAIDVNVNAQKTPILLVGEQKQMLALRNVYKKYSGNEPVIYADKQINNVEIKAIRTDAPFMADKLFQLKVNIWNEALTYLGIANVTSNKKERLITDEVERSLGGVLLNREIRLSERQIACERINKMFGLNVSVEFNEKFSEDEETDIDTTDYNKGGEYDE